MRLVITNQRHEVLLLLKDRKYLRMSELYQLYKGKRSGKPESFERSVRFVMKKMLLHGLVKAEYVPVRSKRFPGTSSPNNEQCFRLTAKGAKLVEGKAISEKNPASLPHDLEITRFHNTLDSFLPGGFKLHWKQEDLQKGVYPDALFAIEHPDKTARYFFLEVEKSKQGHYRDGKSQLIKKIEKYDKIRNTDTPSKDFGWKFRNFRLIIQVENEVRQTNLLEKLSKEMPYSFIWVTTPDGHRADRYLTPKDFSTAEHSILEA